MAKHSCVVADDHSLLREALVSFLRTIEDLEVVAQAADGQEALEATEKHKPELLLTDLQMPKLHGVQLIKKVRELPSPPKVIVVSMLHQPHFVQQAMDAGALGYVLKEATAQELGVAIGAVLNGKQYLCERLHGHMSNSSDQRLSRREEEVLHLIALGASTRDVAEQLFLSPKTVESHRKNIMDKLNLHSVAELTLYAMRSDLIKP